MVVQQEGASETLRERADASVPQQAVAAPRAPGAERVRPYVARSLQQHLIDDPTGRCWTANGSAVLVDISGFTLLSEQLARKGREGAEQISDAIGGSFEAIHLVANLQGGRLLKFGGDAMLFWFHGEGHAVRACRAMVKMRRVLDDVGRIELSDAQVTLQMSQGMHSGEFHFFAVGGSHLEFLVAGPAWTHMVAMEHEAGAGEIVVSHDAAALLPPAWLGSGKGGGLLLQLDPSEESRAPAPTEETLPIASAALEHCLSPAIRAHVRAGGGTPEHRPVTIAFIRFEGADALIDRHGPAAAADALHQLATVVQDAALEQDIAFLGSDVDADGGKLILTGGAPTVTGTDEERMLLALRKIVASELPLPIRVGVHRGAVFAGDIGPRHRRTYTVMGDAVNLAARLMASAGPGQIYATEEVLARSDTLFDATKLRAVRREGEGGAGAGAAARPRARDRRTRQVSLQRLPLIGRERRARRDAQGVCAARVRDRVAWSKSSALPASARRGCWKRCAMPRQGFASSAPPARPTRRRYRMSHGASCCASCSSSVATTPTTGSSRSSATWWRCWHPTLRRGCRCSGGVRRRHRADSRGRAAGRHESPDEAARGRWTGSSRSWCRARC